MWSIDSELIESNRTNNWFGERRRFTFNGNEQRVLTGWTCAMSNESLLERAYALAESGRFESVRDLRLTLLNEGFTYADLDQLTRPTLAKKLAAKIAKAKNLPAADS